MVLKMLPHRYPFLMVDRVIDIRGDEHGIGIKNVTINEPHFQGHFPGQSGVSRRADDRGHGADGRRALHRGDRVTQPKSVFFLTIDKAKFRKPVRPGDTIEYHMDRITRRKIDVVVSRRSQSGGPDRRRSRSRRHAFRRMSAHMIDPSARIEAGATIGKDVFDRSVLHDRRHT